MRQLIVASLQANTDLQDLVGVPPEFRLYQRGSLGHGGIPARPDFPFLLYDEQPSTINRAVRRTSPTSRNRYFQIYGYDEHGSGYMRIEQALGLVRDTLLTLQGQTSPSGARCTDVFWMSTSVDTKDVEYIAAVKFSTFMFVTQ